jgi:hypothetical protein
MKLKTEKGTGGCTSRLFPVECPYSRTHSLNDGVPRLTYVGDVFCRANFCGNFAGISTDEKTIHCNGDDSTS